uniref:Uncharacterized protein n=1 Tax=Stomoxys calcitrans TaxID=35570 RepID=A0A1I8P5W7_STOCA
MSFTPQIGNMGKIIIIVVLYIAGVLADKPDWYPENPTDIEKECLQRYPISKEDKTDIKSLKLNDVPNMSTLLLCVAHGQSVYDIEDELKPERIVYGLYRSLHLNCDVGMVNECLDHHQDHRENGKHEDFLYAFVHCVFERAADECVFDEQ